MTEKAFINTVTEDELVIKKIVAAKMLFILVCIFAGVVSSEGGYIRQNLALGIPQPFAINREILKAQLLPRGIGYAVHDVPEKDVSYSLSYEDYLYLKRYKVEGQDSPFNPDPLEPGPTIADIAGKYKRDQVKFAVPYSDAALKRGAGNAVNRCQDILLKAPVLPEVHKHVYFHAPPPEFEDPLGAPRVIQPTKKNVNILFIKAPSYEPTSGYLHQLLQKQQVPIEDKTLIYVLSKKENLTQPVVLPPPKPSAPEVYFVKYKTSNDIESINNVLSLPGLLQNVSPVLEQRRAARDP